MKDQAARLRELACQGSLPTSLPKRTSPGRCRARVIAVTGGKGGVGKTTLAVNLGVALAELPSRVLVVDADLGLANVDVMLGIDPGLHVGHLLLPQYAPEDVVLDGPGGIKFISGGSGLQELADASPQSRALLLSKLRSYYEQFDYVLVDTSPGIGNQVTDFLRDADDILLVTTSEPTSLRDAYATLKVVHRELQSSSVSIVVNGASPHEAERAVEAINQVALKFLGCKCRKSYCIASDLLVGKAISRCKPLVREYPKSPAATCIRHIATALSERGAQSAVPSCSLEAAHVLA